MYSICEYIYVFSTLIFSRDGCLYVFYFLGLWDNRVIHGNRRGGEIEVKKCIIKIDFHLKKFHNIIYNSSVFVPVLHQPNPNLIIMYNVIIFYEKMYFGGEILTFTSATVFFICMKFTPYQAFQQTIVIE